MDHVKTQTPAPSYMQASGKLPHTLVNDYLFKALLQKNETVLKGLVCSLLHLLPQEIASLEIKNPILLGKALTEDYDSKTFILDLNVLLNDNAVINLEMQIIDYENWPERSLAYLCRNFDQLQRGNDYLLIKPVVHVSFLDFVLFQEYPEFYATYKMMNVKNHHIYSDKIILNVVDLTHIELATPEDREWGIDHWASLFKATTWEELKAMAQENQIMAEAVQTVYELTADESIRYQCLAREKQIKEMNTVLGMKERAFQERDAAFQERDAAVAMVSQRDQQINRQAQQLVQKDQQINRQGQQLVQKDQQIAELLEEIQRLKEGGTP